MEKGYFRIVHQGDITMKRELKLKVLDMLYRRSTIPSSVLIGPLVWAFVLADKTEKCISNIFFLRKHPNC
jgi:hypothetical protein